MEPTGAREPDPARRAAKILGAVALEAGGTFLLIGHLTGHIWLGAALLLVAVVSYLVAYRWGLVHDRLFLALWVGVAVVGALVSLVAGPLNGLTDEPFLMPAFAQLWPNLYGSPVTVTYVQYGTTHTTPELYNVYLPFLAYVAIPFVSYKWTSFAAWVASVYLLRQRPHAVVLWGSFWVGVMAANGFNDYVPFLVLVLAFVTLTGASSKLAEFVSLGLKQFANVVVVALHLYRRQWRDAAIAVAVTAAILAPFAYLSPGGTWCHAILIEPGACGGGAGPVFGEAVLSHLNYPLWVLFVLAVFGTGFVRGLRGAPPGGARGRAGEWLRRHAPGPAESH